MAGPISTDIVNEALALSTFDGPLVSGVAPFFDGVGPNASTAGKAAAALYTPAVAAVARMHGWDFARTSLAMISSGGTAPVPWLYEFLYPVNCAELLEIMPPSLVDPNNPAPYDKARGINIIGGNQVSVIWANISPAVGVFTSLPVESTWDSLFRASLVRYLASEFALDLMGKPDLAQQLLEQMGTIQQVAAARRDE